MARRTLRTTPAHADGTHCTHQVNTRGIPRDPNSGCTGRTNYIAACSCGWTATKHLRLLADDARAKHALTHTTTPAAQAS